MLDTPSITESAARSTAFIHLIVPWDEMRTVIGPARIELASTIAAQGVATAGPWFSHHRRRPTDTFDFEISVPVARAIRSQGRIESGELRPARVARTVYHGDYDGLGKAWGAFYDWLATNGHVHGDDLFESYLVGPESSAAPADWQTEFTVPLR